jgi:hypothetical protein
MHTLAQGNDELLTAIYFRTAICTHILHMANRRIQKLLFWTTMAKQYLFPTLYTFQDLLLLPRVSRIILGREKVAPDWLFGEAGKNCR